MASTPNVGRIAGGLMLVHFVVGLMLPYNLLVGAIGTSDGYRFLDQAARNAASLRASVFLLLFGAAVRLGISIAAYPVLRESSRRLTIGVLALAVANVPLQAVEGGMVLSMLAVSQQYAGAGAADGATRVVVAAIGSTHQAIHYMQLLTMVAWIVVLCAALWRAALVPRVLAFAMFIACALQIAGVPVRGLLGYPVLIERGLPLAPAYVGVALWLLGKGFDQRRPISLAAAPT